MKFLKLSSRALLQSLWLVSFVGTSAMADKLIDGTAAIVQGKVILHSELVQAEADLKEELKKRNKWDNGISDEEFRRKTLEQLINTKLLQAELSRRGLQVEDRDVDLAVETVMKDNRIGSLSQFQTLLAQEGLTLPEYRENLKKQIEHGRVLAALVRPQIQLREEDIARELKAKGLTVGNHAEYDLSMISVSAQVKEKLGEQIKAEASANFGEAAKKYNEGALRDSSGHIGLVKPEDMQENLSAVLPSLDVKVVSNWIEANDKWNLLFVDHIKRDSLLESTDKQVEAVRNEMTERAGNEVMERLLKSLREKSKISIYQEASHS